MKARSGALTDAHVRNAKPRAKLYRVADGGGLCLEVHPNGARYWRLRYRHGGKARMHGLGVWPEVGLKEARQKAADAQRKVAAGLDPVRERKSQSRQLALAVANTFEALGREWLEHNPNRLAPVTLGKARWLLESFAFPTFGGLPIVDVKPSEILPALRQLEASGKLETAHRLRALCSRVYRYAIASDRAASDPTRDLGGAIRTTRARNHARLTDPEQVGKLLRCIDAFDGQYITRAALRLAPLVFVRPGELRAAQWAEFDLDGGTWTIPAERMKRKDQGQHIVPLARQAVAILRELHALTGRNRLLFPSVRSPKRCMSENTMTYALRRMGFTGDQMTAHGFRGTASTLLHERGYASPIIERQLAHGQQSKVAAAYNHAEYLPERRRMMQYWADYLDQLRSNSGG